MAGSTKRTRHDDNEQPPPSSSSSSTDTAPSTPTHHPNTRNNTTTATSASAGTPRRQATASTSASTPTRPILTRSAATHTPVSRTNGLSRSTSLLNVSTRRSMPGSMAAPSSSSATSSGSGSSSGRVGMLTRTQSTPQLVSPTQLKQVAAAAAGGSGGAAGKGDDDSGLGGPGGRRFGKGKENIPPKKDEENEPEEGSSRKRPRMSSRGSVSGRTGRGRSGSVASVRSETSGRHSSLAPSSSASSICSWSARLPSPAPSQASSAAQTADTATSVDPLDLIQREGDDDEFDLDRTPTKSRPVTRSTASAFLPTPPPSSPSVRDAELTERVSLIRVQGDKADVDANMDDEHVKGKKLNPYKQLKAFLRLSSTPSDTVATVDQTIIGREEEKTVLRSYLANRNDVDVGMYVSGPPGTGKTALVTALGRQLAQDGWKVVELGCMGLKVTEIWRRLGEELACGKTEKDVKETIEQDGAKVIVILDEIDSLMPPPPSIAPPATSHLLTKLFTLPLSSPTVKLVAISNTLDLTLRARLVLPDNAQPTILPFRAYGAAEMAPIVSARLAAADVEGVKIDQTAVMLLTKKVEAQNGDLRMCLGVLASAITLAEAEWIKKTSSAAAAEPGKTVPMTKVAVPHILKALTSYTQQLKAAAGSAVGGSTATGKKIRSVQLQGKMVLVSMLIYLSRVRAGLNGCPAIGSGSITPPLTPGKAPSTELTAQNLYATYSHILSHASSPFPPAAESDYRDLLSNLETLGLISVAQSIGMTRSSSSSSRGKAGNGGRVELCVREDEVREGLGLVEGQQKGIAEEEVKRIWQREEGRVKRVREKAAAVAEAEKEDYF